MKKPHFFCAVLLAILLLSSGCGGTSGPPRTAVTGKVTYKGQPIPVGMVMARPAEGASGVGGTANIQDGTYAFDESNGPEPGKKYVLIVNLRDFGAQKAGSLKPGASGAAPSPLAALKLPPGKVEWMFDLETPAEGDVTKDLNIE